MGLSPSAKRGIFSLLLLFVVAAAAVPRLAILENRPMHCDEAVHGVKFGLLLEHADYLYDPYEYHGPSLNFLTLPVAYLASAQNVVEITEVHLRLVPAIFGILLVGLVWPLRHELGLPAALCAAVLTAVSPAMVFYSRYYIQEMLLVCFTFAAMAALWGYAREVTCSGTRHYSRLRQGLWLVLLGLCIGMMHASKETCVIALFAITVAAALTIGSLRRIGPRPATISVLVVLLVAANVSILLFSSFMANPRGVLDSVTTYFHYLGRASGEGSVGRHVYPWDYYLRVLFWWQRGEGPVWSEASIAALALVGLAAGATGKGLRPANLPVARFLAVYTVLMTLIYSALPYKTPWCALSLLHGLILLAGIGAAALFRLAPGYILKGAAVVLVAAATLHLAWQAHRASFVAYEHPGNPYVYAHTTDDVPLLAERIKRIAAAGGDGPQMHVQVICSEADYWPLPWYLRGMRRVGWFDRMPDGRAAPLIVIQPKLEKALLEYLYVKPPPGERPLYVPLAYEEQDRDWRLRPHVDLRLYLQLELRDAYLSAEP